MSLTLLIGALQGVVLACLLFRARANQPANRYLALLILGVAALITPFIIGYAGAYDAWPWLSFAPFSYTLAFGPLIYLYTISLVSTPPRHRWPHFVPVLLQWLADALIFPLPLTIKNHWNEIANEPYLLPLFETATLISIAVYGWIAFGHYRRYRRWLDEQRADRMDFDPAWIRNFLIALSVMALVWLGFQIANWIHPERNYFDQFWLYVAFSGLVIYLGVAGWRHCDTAFPDATTSAPPSPESTTTEPTRDWAAQGEQWLAQIDRDVLWRDPDLTLASLARQLGTNTAYLSRGLNEVAGENFNAIINRRRIAAVQGWLKSPSETRDLLTIAFDAGFRSKASFNRAFVSFVGMTPTAWRLKS